MYLLSTKGKTMNQYYSNKNIEKGVDGLPEISKVTLRNMRKDGLKYIKIGRSIFYKKEWIEDYLNGNIRPAKVDNNNE